MTVVWRLRRTAQAWVSSHGLKKFFFYEREKRGCSFTMYGGGYPLSSTTIVVGVIALVLILVLGGLTAYLLYTRGSDDKGDKGGDSCAFERGQLQEAQKEIAELKGKHGGFLTKKTGFFGVQIWVLLVAASAVAFLVFQAYFGPAVSRGINNAAGYFGSAVSNVTPSAVSRAVSRLPTVFGRRRAPGSVELVENAPGAAEAQAHRLSLEAGVGAIPPSTYVPYEPPVGGTPVRRAKGWGRRSGA